MQNKPYNNALKIVQTLVSNGHTAYFAGGCVRDKLRGEDFGTSDIDIASDATPEQVKVLFAKTIAVGEQYGVVVVVLDAINYEIATFRKDLEYEDGRRPEGVEFVSAKEDALRRDFTINGMFYDPLKEELIDYVNGQEDLERNIIRAIGDAGQRFKEDKLRMMRAVRFAARFQFKIEDQTWSALQKSSQDITQVSQERIRDELVKMFTGPHRGDAMQLLHDAGLLKQILPEIAAMDGVEQPPEYHPEGDVFVHTKMMLDLLPDKPSIYLAFGALFHDVGKPPTYTVSDRIRFNKHDHVGAEMTDEICKRLKFSNEERKQICLYVGQHMRFGAVKDMREGKLKKMLQRESIHEELEMLKADCQASHNNMDAYHFCHQKLKEYSEEDLRPDLFVTGKLLLEWGYHPSPQFKEMISTLEELQLEGQIQTLEEAKAYVQKHYPHS